MRLNEDDDTEPPCERCYVVLDEGNVKAWDIYSLVRNQVRVAPMGEIIGLDHNAVLGDIKLYVDANEIKKTFEGVLECFHIEQELKSEFS